MKNEKKEKMIKNRVLYLNIYNSKNKIDYIFI